MDEKAIQKNILLGEIARDKNAGLKSFYAEYGRLIYAVALSVTKKSFLADEAVNETLLRVWKTAEKGKKEVSEGWLYTVALNAAKSVLKRNFFIPLTSDEACENAEITRFEDDSFFEYLDFVGEKEREILIFRFVSEMTFEEIAAATGKKLSTVTSVYYRALDKIKKTLEKRRKPL